MENIPYIVYEGAEARHERHIKRMIIALVISIVLLFLSNAAWLYAWVQYDYQSESNTTTVDGKYGSANFIGGNGDIKNGENYSEDSENQQNP